MTPLQEKRAKAKAERQARVARRQELRAVKKRIPFPFLRARIAEWIAQGGTDEQIASRAANWIDETLKFAGLPGPWDAMAEALDGPVAYAIALPLVREVRKAVSKA